MKKLYSLLALVAFSASVNAQNLVNNPTFDDGLNGWTAGFTTTYTLPTLVAGDGSDGANSVQYIPTATNGFYQEIPITAGAPLNISFWYKATGDGTDARIWSNYKDAAGTIIYQNGQSSAVGDPLRTDNSYLPTSDVWVQHNISVTTPANVTVFALAVRAYNGGTVSFDQFSVTQTPLSVSQNAIAGLDIYPNPVTNGVLNINTTANDAKNVMIYDVLGKQVVNTTISGNTVNVANLKNGVYIVKITENGKTATRKLVIR
ncbi:MAG: T9SS type A sorting domain-containing protein [Flavobacterium sp.]|uniref:T9SS type A sorting domain-containing protein n=1 Tax=Flavobacterium sp. TaxID=239 RepID=UPI0022C5EF78|nr:T9SS type A sorting domain-containing protein [Flavobacterium sp.]MCZ8196207.1 T9SS type A sorting domain-containing protein [Flavobacterium sp.]